MKPGDLWLHLEAYLALKKALGFPLGVRERLLRDFVAFAEINGIRGTFNAQVAFDWACSVSDRCGISGRAARLSVARQFLSHVSAIVPGIEVPSATLLAGPRRRKPFLFSDEEIIRLLKAALSLILQYFFTEHLVSHKQVSPRTIVAYRDSFRLLLQFLKKRTGKRPFTLCVDDLDAPAIVDFLESLEEQRGNQVCSRNARLTAIRSFFHVVALRDPGSIGVVGRVLAIPKKTEFRCWPWNAAIGQTLAKILAQRPHVNVFDWQA